MKQQMTFWCDYPDASPCDLCFYFLVLQVVIGSGEHANDMKLMSKSQIIAEAVIRYLFPCLTGRHLKDLRSLKKLRLKTYLICSF